MRMVGVEKMLAGKRIPEDDRRRFVEAVAQAPGKSREVLVGLGVDRVLEGLKQPGFMDRVGQEAEGEVGELAPPKPVFVEVLPDGTVNLLHGVKG